jgi:hypothetical protein
MSSFEGLVLEFHTNKAVYGRHPVGQSISKSSTFVTEGDNTGRGFGVGGWQNCFSEESEPVIFPTRKGPGVSHRQKTDG